MRRWRAWSSRAASSQAKALSASSSATRPGAASSRAVGRSATPPTARRMPSGIDHGGAGDDREIAVAARDLAERVAGAGRGAGETHGFDHLVVAPCGREHAGEEVLGRHACAAAAERSATSPPSATRHSGISALGSACATEPQTVPRLRVWHARPRAARAASSGDWVAKPGLAIRSDCVTEAPTPRCPSRLSIFRRSAMAETSTMIPAEGGAC